MADIPPMSSHQLEVCKQLTPMGKRLFRFIEFDDDEVLLAEIRKHVIGLIFIWLTGGFITIVLVLATMFLAVNTDTVGTLGVSSGESFQGAVMAIGLILGFFSIVVTLITSILYSSSAIFVTNEKIAEVTYVSLFHRRVIQLSIGNVEDATVVQRGILPHLFHYGSLLVETAGETKNPDFTFVPDPNRNSRIIIQAHEEYVEKHGN